MDLGALTAFHSMDSETGKDPGHVRRKPVGPLDSELQLHRRSHGRHPSESDHKDQRFHPIPAPMLKEYHGVFTGNIIARQRMKDIGILCLKMLFPME